MTAADHANTVREALKWVPDGYDQVDLGHEGPLRREATQALDALQAQAEAAEAERDRLERINARLTKDLADLQRANDHLRSQIKEMHRAALAGEDT